MSSKGKLIGAALCMIAFLAMPDCAAYSVSPAEMSNVTNLAAFMQAKLNDPAHRQEALAAANRLRDMWIFDVVQKSTDMYEIELRSSSQSMWESFCRIPVPTMEVASFADIVNSLSNKIDEANSDIAGYRAAQDAARQDYASAIGVINDRYDAVSDIIDLRTDADKNLDKTIGNADAHIATSEARVARWQSQIDSKLTTTPYTDAQIEAQQDVIDYLETNDLVNAYTIRETAEYAAEDAYYFAQNPEDAFWDRAYTLYYLISNEFGDYFFPWEDGYTSAYDYTIAYWSAERDNALNDNAYIYATNQLAIIASAVAAYNETGATIKKNQYGEVEDVTLSSDWTKSLWAAYDEAMNVVHAAEDGVAAVRNAIDEANDTLEYMEATRLPYDDFVDAWSNKIVEANANIANYRDMKSAAYQNYTNTIESINGYYYSFVASFTNHLETVLDQSNAVYMAALAEYDNITNLLARYSDDGQGFINWLEDYYGYDDQYKYDWWLEDNGLSEMELKREFRAFRNRLLQELEAAMLRMMEVQTAIDELRVRIANIIAIVEEVNDSGGDDPSKWLVERVQGLKADAENSLSETIAEKDAQIVAANARIETFQVQIDSMRNGYENSDAALRVVALSSIWRGGKYYGCYAPVPVYFSANGTVPRAMEEFRYTEPFGVNDEAVVTAFAATNVLDLMGVNLTGLQIMVQSDLCIGRLAATSADSIGTEWRDYIRGVNQVDGSVWMVSGTRDGVEIVAPLADDIAGSVSIPSSLAFFDSVGFMQEYDETCGDHIATNEIVIAEITEAIPIYENQIAVFDWQIAVLEELIDTSDYSTWLSQNGLTASVEAKRQYNAYLDSLFSELDEYYDIREELEGHLAGLQAQLSALQEEQDELLATPVEPRLVEVPVVGIGDWAFGDCAGITSVTIPEGVTDIRDGAFYGCTSLTNVTIPASVTSIGEDAFYGCNALRASWIRTVVAAAAAGGIGGGASSATPAVQEVDASYALSDSLADRAVATVTVDADCAIDSFVLREGKVYDAMLRIVNTADHEVRLTLPAGYVYETFRGVKPLTIPANSRNMLTITRTAENVFLVSREELETVQ